MRNSPLLLVLSVILLVVGAAVEELVPKVCGVGFPALLVTVQFMASRRTALSMALFAIAAGAVEDSLSSLPAMTSASYFLAVAVLVRWSGLPRGTVVLTYPFYQLWLKLWASGLGGNIFQRALVALPVGLAAAFLTGVALSWLERGIALDEEE